MVGGGDVRRRGWCVRVCACVHVCVHVLCVLCCVCVCACVCWQIANQLLYIMKAHVCCYSALHPVVGDETNLVPQERKREDRKERGGGEGRRG